MKIKNLKLKIKNYCQGQAVISVVVFLLIMSLVIISSFSAIVLRETKNSQHFVFSKRSYFLAEAGLEDALYRIKNNKLISSEEIIELGEGDVTTNISDILGGNKKIISVGNVSGDIRKIEAELTNSTGVNFFYGAQIGEGGLKMGQNSRIEGAGGASGNMYSNGSAVGENGATITGDAIVATSVSEDSQARSIVCSNPPDGDQIVGKANPQIDFSQSFIPSDSKPLAKISLYIKKAGSPNDRNIYITLDNNGSPAKNNLAQGVLKSSLVGTNYSWIDVTFSNPANLTNGTKYWIVLDTSQDSNDYWVWCKDKDQGYGNGAGKYSQDWDDDPWTLIVGDLTFKTYLGAGLGSIENIDVNGTARANTIKDSAISGDAYYQAIINSTVGGSSYPNSPDPPLLDMPISQANIDQWKSDAEAGGVINGNCGNSGAPACTIDNDGILTLGPKKINGNLALTKKQTLIVSGTLYFTGYINMDSSSGATIKCSPSFGTKSCIVITDSWVHIRNNANFIGSGQTGSYLMVLTDLDGCNGGAQKPQCTDHNAAIDFHNNAKGAIFYCPKSMVYLHNGVEITEVVAYKLELDNTATVIYDEGLINSFFSSGPGGGFSITKWKEI